MVSRDLFLQGVDQVALRYQEYVPDYFILRVSL
jgi:hypothetical protein